MYRRDEGLVVAHPRQLALNVKKGHSDCMVCSSRKSGVFDTNSLEEKTFDEPAERVNFENALVSEKNRLDHLSIFISESPHL